MIWAELFKGVRKENRLTQVQMSQVLGISQPSVSKIEKGLAEPSAPAFVRLARLSMRGGPNGRVRVRQFMERAHL